MSDLGNNPLGNIDTSITLSSLIKAGIAVALTVGAFYAIIAGIKADGVAESKANSISIYNLQVELAVAKSRFDTISAEVKQIREDEKSTYADLKATIDKMLSTLTQIQISFATITQPQPASGSSGRR